MAVHILVVAVLTVGLYNPVEAQTCPGGTGACNCQLNNVESLRTLIRSEVQAQVEAEVARQLNSTPALGLLYIARTSVNSLRLSNISGETVRGRGPVRAEIPNFNSSARASSNNLLAYHPNFRDGHSSGLAAILINMVEAFPCINALSSFPPACKVYTYEDDGLRDGRALIEASDTGGSADFRIAFNGTVKGVFAFGFTGCPELTTNCFPRFTEYLISCLLPRNICG